MTQVVEDAVNRDIPFVLSAGNNADGNGLGNFKYAVPSNHFAICSKNLATEV